MKIAVVSYWRSKGIKVPYEELPYGRSTNSLGKWSDIEVLINRLDEANRGARTNLPQRPYQETHEHIRSLFHTFFEPSLVREMRRSSPVNYAELQVACANIMQFS